MMMQLTVANLSPERRRRVFIEPDSIESVADFDNDADWGSPSKSRVFTKTGVCWHVMESYEEICHKSQAAGFAHILTPEQIAIRDGDALQQLQ